MGPSSLNTGRFCARHEVGSSRSVSFFFLHRLQARKAAGPTTGIEKNVKAPKNMIKSIRPTDDVTTDVVVIAARPPPISGLTGGGADGGASGMSGIWWLMMKSAVEHRPGCTLVAEHGHAQGLLLVPQKSAPAGLAGLWLPSSHSSPFSLSTIPSPQHPLCPALVQRVGRDGLVPLASIRPVSVPAVPTGAQDG